MHNVQNMILNANENYPIICIKFHLIDTRDKGKATLDDVPIMREYPYVFLEDLSGVPPETQVEFRIDLVPGVASIAKEPYRLAPPKMQELST